RQGRGGGQRGRGGGAGARGRQRQQQDEDEDGKTAGVGQSARGGAAHDHRQSPLEVEHPSEAARQGRGADHAGSMGRQPFGQEIDRFEQRTGVGRAGAGQLA